MDPRRAFAVGCVAVRLKFFERWMHGSRELADDFIRSGIDDWAAEGHLAQEEAVALRDALSTPEVSAVTANLGAHLAMSIPLRFPLGSLARFFWTLVARIRAQWPAIRGKTEARDQCSIHTVPVMLLALVPGFGAGAYLLAKPLRSNKALPAIILDRFLRKLPARLYGRLHFVELTIWWSRPDSGDDSDRTPGSLRHRARRRLGMPAALWVLLLLVLLANAGLYLATVDAESGDGEFGLVDTLAAAQFLAAGVLGMLSFKLFWRHSSPLTTRRARGGIFLWPAVGIGLLLFAVDNFLNLHKGLGDWIEDHADIVPLATSSTADIMTLTYVLLGIVVLAAFRTELFAPRASGTLLLAGMLAAAAMLGTDLFDRDPQGQLHLAAQMAASAVLLLAFLVRYLEIRDERREGGAQPTPLLAEVDRP